MNVGMFFQCNPAPRNEDTLLELQAEYADVVSKVEIPKTTCWNRRK